MTFFGYNGIHLNLPESYCLIRGLGDSSKGELALGPDDRGELIIHYQTIKNADLAKLEKDYFETSKSRTLETKKKLDHHRYYYVYREGGESITAVLIPKDCQGRTIRLLWLGRKSVTHKELCAITEPLLSVQKGHRWSFFNVDMCLPSSWNLQESRLNAGCYHLKLQHNRHGIQVWALSLFSQLLNKQNVEDWLPAFLEARFPKQYRWKVVASGHQIWSVRGRMRFRWWMNMAQLLNKNKRVKGVISVHTQDNQAYLLIHDGKENSPIERPIEFKGKACLIS